MNVPVALFVYNRPDHTIKVLDGLKKNDIETLYVFVDALKGSDANHRWNQEILDMVEKIDWCQVKIFKNQENLGLSLNIRQGINRIFEDYQSVIILEDDCVPLEGFYLYMKKYLGLYENRKKVMTINGYRYPIEIPQTYPYEAYFTNIPTSWGWATWKDRWELFEHDENKYRRLMKNRDFLTKIDRINPQYRIMMNFQLNKLVNSWAIFWCFNIVEHEGVCINPTVSLIDNVGMDGSGVHSRFSEKYIDKTEQNYNDEILDTTEYLCQFELLEHDFFKRSFSDSLKNAIFKYKIMRPVHRYIKGKLMG